MSQKRPSSASDQIRVLLAGALSVAVGKTSMAPIERIKILLQTQEANKKIQDGIVKRYTGFWNCFSRIIREQGVIALWRGNFPDLIRYFPTQALNFLLKDTYKKYFCPYNPRTDYHKFFLGNLASGGAAGATALLIVYPLDFGRTRLAADIGRKADRQFSGLFNCLSQITKTDGIAGLYRGYIVTVAIYFGFYDNAKQILTNIPIMNNVAAKFLVAQVVTMAAGFLSYPLDTIRRRLMMQSGREDVLYKDYIDCILKIKRNEGTKAFFRGALINVFRGVGGASVLVLYDSVIHFR